jgi:hypothetical protein
MRSGYLCRDVSCRRRRRGAVEGRRRVRQVGRWHHSLGLQAHEEGKCFQAKVATVDEIAQENEAHVGTVGRRSELLRGGARRGGLRTCIVVIGFSLFFLALAVAAGLDLLAQLGVGDLGRWLDHVGADDGFGAGGRLNSSIAGHPTGDTEQLKQIIELAVNVAADGDGGDNGLDVALWREQRRKVRTGSQPASGGGASKTKAKRRKKRKRQRKRQRQRQRKRQRQRHKDTGLDIPSIKTSFTISHSCFMMGSGR